MFFAGCGDHSHQQWLMRAGAARVHARQGRCCCFKRVWANSAGHAARQSSTTGGLAGCPFTSPLLARWARCHKADAWLWTGVLPGAAGRATWQSCCTDPQAGLLSLDTPSRKLGKAFGRLSIIALVQLLVVPVEPVVVFPGRTGHAAQYRCSAGDLVGDACDTWTLSRHNLPGKLTPAVRHCIIQVPVQVLLLSNCYVSHA